MDHERRMYFLAEEEGVVVGFIRLWNSPHINEWVADGIVVRPSHRQKGVGIRLLECAMEKAARTAIENHSVEAQTELIAAALSSDAAKAFLANMPSVETLMPTLDATEIRGLLGYGTRNRDAQ